jgi:dihydrofolate reductase
MSAMTKLLLDISMSLDGYVAGPRATLEEPLGSGGEGLHTWVIRLKSWRERHGLEGGETGPDDELMRESVAVQGALIMGRRMFSGGEGPWSDDPKADGWWGDDPPFHVPVFVLTSHPRERVEKPDGTSYTFVTDGIESALAQARAAAGDRDVVIVGGANVAQQYLRAGLVDDLHIHVASLFLGGGVRLFDNVGADVEYEQVRALEGNGVVHLHYRRVTPS